MSFIGSLPFVEKVLDSLKTTELQRLKTLIDNPAAEPVGFICTYGYKPDALSSVLNVSDEFRYVEISYDWIGKENKRGILVKTATNAWALLLWKPKTKVMSTVELFQNGGDAKFNVLNEQLTTEEFRRVLSDRLVEIEKGPGDVDIKLVTNLPATGEENTIYLSDTNIVTDDPAVVIPSPAVADIGKMLMVGNDRRYHLASIPDGLRVITVSNENYETPLQDILSTDELNDLFNAKACLRFQAGGLESSNYIIYYPQYGKNETRLIRFEMTGSSQHFMYCVVMNDGSLSCYDLFDNEEEFEIPLEVGTKLYSHQIDMTDNDNVSLEFYVISTKSEAYVLNDFIDILMQGKDYISCSQEVGNDRFMFAPIAIYWEPSTLKMYFTCLEHGSTDISEAISFVTTPDITDTVTTL